MRMVVVSFLGLAMAAPAGPATAQHRELGAHEHGRGTLNIAVEGARLSMELEVPGVDIVGFEHAAKTGTQKGAVEKVKKLLSAPQALFKLPVAVLQFLVLTGELPQLVLQLLNAHLRIDVDGLRRRLHR